jgi:hypothetical protein
VGRRSLRIKGLPHAQLAAKTCPGPDACYEIGSFGLHGSLLPTLCHLRYKLHLHPAHKRLSRAAVCEAQSSLLNRHLPSRGKGPQAIDGLRVLADVDKPTCPRKGRPKAVHVHLALFVDLSQTFLGLVETTSVIQVEPRSGTLIPQPLTGMIPTWILLTPLQLVSLAIQRRPVQHEARSSRRRLADAHTA